MVSMQGEKIVSTCIQYLMKRYFGEKGQGFTEYAIILLRIVLIGCMVYSMSTIKSQVDSLYSFVSSHFTFIAGADNGNFTTSSGFFRWYG